MQHYILPETIGKGETAGKRLSSLNWPKAKHQKLIDMRYNVGFTAVAATPETKLPRKANLSIPLLNPSELKSEQVRFLKLFKSLAVVTAHRKNIELRLQRLMSLDAKNELKREKEIAKLRGQARDYLKQADAVAKDCAAASEKCTPKAAGQWLKSKVNYKAFLKKADDLEKKLRGEDAKFDKAINAMIRDLKEFQRVESYFDTALKDTIALIKGVAGVMP